MRPARERAERPVRLAYPLVHARQLVVEDGVVVAELQQLRVRDLEHIGDVGVPARLEDERMIPGDHCQVVLVVHERLTQQLGTCGR